MKERSVFLREGIRSPRSIIVASYLQRILDALPVPQVKKTGATLFLCPSGQRQSAKVEHRL